MCVLQHSFRSGPIIHNPTNDTVIDRRRLVRSFVTGFLSTKFCRAKLCLVSMKFIKIDGLRKVYRLWYLGVVGACNGGTWKRDGRTKGFNSRLS